MDTQRIRQEITYRSSRSGGSGGQNVNKVETKMEARLHIASSGGLSEDEKARITTKLANRISEEGYLSVASQTGRTQLTNRDLAEHRLLALLKKALHQQAVRKPTRTPAGAVEDRLRTKKIQAAKKRNRRDFGTAADT
ncbi:MAG: alternative ribosome rescue aminoacyl-tRNA hydrolase ArfB [Bacteroidia bacterium]|nr:alternative ribosome rescue aminoacyl-tRNA hydrolase ArfB [Bacteroidia bacterium]